MLFGPSHVGLLKNSKRSLRTQRNKHFYQLKKYTNSRNKQQDCGGTKQQK